MNRDKAIKIGLLLVITFGVLYWGFNFLSGKNVFTKTNTYYAYYDRIDGLQKNSNILLRGHKIGQVVDIYFTDNTYKQITVVMTIQKDIEIPENTIARVFSSDLMGTKSIELLLPDMTAGYKILQHNGILLSEIEGSISDQVRLEMAPIKAQAEKLMEVSAGAIDQIKYVLNEETGEQIRSAIQSIQNSTMTINNILTTSNKSIQKAMVHIEDITQNISSKSSEISSIIDNFDVVGKDLANSNIPGVFAKTDSVMTEMGILLTNINTGNGTFQALITDKKLYDNMESSTKNMNSLINDIQTNPHKYVSFPIFDFSKDK